MQEIPATFTAETGWPAEENCALLTSISTLKEWPVRFRRLPDMQRGISATSVGGGWARFVEEQNLGHGAFLTFEVVDDRRLVVALHTRNSAEDCPPARGGEFGHTLLRDSREHEHSSADNSQPTLSTVLCSDRCDERPHFIKTLRKTNMMKRASCKLVSDHSDSN